MSLRLAGAVLAVAALLAGGYLWVRDSPFVRVKDVHVVGVSSSEGRAIRAALRRAALDMTTLHVREDQLRVAVEPYASVADLRAEADFPHELTIEVVERLPLAAVEIGGRRLPVGAGGLVMRGVRAPAELPTIKASRVTAGSRIADEPALEAVEVLAAAPPELRGRVSRAVPSRRGLTLDMRGGPDLVFGEATRVGAKWAAAVRVLADHTSAGATYLDLRLPERVAAGGLDPVENPQAIPENTATLDQ